MIAVMLSILILILIRSTLIRISLGVFQLIVGFLIIVLIFKILESLIMLALIFIIAGLLILVLSLKTSKRVY